MIQNVALPAIVTVYRSQAYKGKITDFIWEVYVYYVPDSFELALGPHFDTGILFINTSYVPILTGR